MKDTQSFLMCLDISQKEKGVSIDTPFKVVAAIIRLPRETFTLPNSGGAFMY
jgi:hypothetical protein